MVLLNGRVRRNENQALLVPACRQGTGVSHHGRLGTREEFSANLGRISQCALERESAACLGSAVIHPVRLLRSADGRVQCDPESNPGACGTLRKKARQAWCP